MAVDEIVRNAPEMLFARVAPVSLVKDATAFRDDLLVNSPNPLPPL